MKLKIYQKHPFDNGEPAKLSKGEACVLWKSATEKSLTMACPECGEELGLIDHKIIWHDENTVTVEPSIQHEKYGEAGAQVLHLQCGAHFFIKNNEILDSNGQVIDYK